jgi:hypothetical protein
VTVLGVDTAFDWCNNGGARMVLGARGGELPVTAAVVVAAAAADIVAGGFGGAVAAAKERGGDSIVVLSETEDDASSGDTVTVQASFVGGGSCNCDGGCLGGLSMAGGRATLVTLAEDEPAATSPAETDEGDVIGCTD